MIASDFARAVGFRTLMLNADKGGGTGGSGKKTDLEQLQDAQEEIKTLKSDLTAAQTVQEKTEKELADEKASVKKLTDEKAQVEQDRDAATKAKDHAEKAKTEAEGAKTKAEVDLKTADERAEQKLREIDAKNGGTLPPKKPGAGDHTKEAEIDATAPPRERLKQIYKVVGED